MSLAYALDIDESFKTLDGIRPDGQVPGTRLNSESRNGIAESLGQAGDDLSPPGAQRGRAGLHVGTGGATASSRAQGPQRTAAVFIGPRDPAAEAQLRKNARRGAVFRSGQFSVLMEGDDLLASSQEKEIPLRKLASLLLAAASLAVGIAPTALAAVPGSRGPTSCQGYDVSHYQANNPPGFSGPFGSIVSGYAQDGRLVGFVHSAADCGNN